jgi:hypothetical protein
MDTISWANLVYLSLLWTMLSLACAGVTQILKTPVKIAWKQRIGKTLRGDHLAMYNWSIRTLTIMAGVGAGVQDHVWPVWVSKPWCIMLGATAGCMSVGVYHAMKVIVPQLISMVPDAIRKRFGG